MACTKIIFVIFGDLFFFTVMGQIKILICYISFVLIAITQAAIDTDSLSITERKLLFIREYEGEYGKLF